MNKEKALTAIIRHLELCNEKSKDWYVGITDDVERFLLDHHIDKIHELWIERKLNSAEEAKELKNDLVEKFHMNGENEKEQGIHILAYKKHLPANP